MAALAADALLTHTKKRVTELKLLRAQSAASAAKMSRLNLLQAASGMTPSQSMDNLKVGSSGSLTPGSGYVMSEERPGSQLPLLSPPLKPGQSHVTVGQVMQYHRALKEQRARSQQDLGAVAASGVSVELPQTRWGQ